MSPRAAQALAYGLTVGALLLLLFSGTSSARWSDVESSPVGELRLGTIDIGLEEDALLGGDQETTTTVPETTTTDPGTPPPPPPPSTTVPVNVFANLLPGDVIYAGITVTNTASVARRYALRLAPTTDGFFAYMTTDAQPVPCASASWGPPAVDMGNEVILGDPTPGPQTGDRVLEAGASEELCVRFSVSTSAGNTLQGVTATRDILAIAEDA